MCVQLQHTIDEVPVKQQVYMFLWYILVIMYMFSANVQAIIVSYLTTQKICTLTRSEMLDLLKAGTVNI